MKIFNYGNDYVLERELKSKTEDAADAANEVEAGAAGTGPEGPGPEEGEEKEAEGELEEGGDEVAGSQESEPEAKERVFYKKKSKRK